MGACARCAIKNQPLMEAIAAASMRSLRDFGFQGIADMAWSFAVCSVLHAGLISALENCLPLLPGFVVSDPTTCVRGLQRFIWGLWKMSRPGAASAAVGMSMAAGLVPDPHMLSVLLMDV